jgi:hypothetical protein
MCVIDWSPAAVVAAALAEAPPAAGAAGVAGEDVVPGDAAWEAAAVVESADAAEIDGSAAEAAGAGVAGVLVAAVCAHPAPAHSARAARTDSADLVRRGNDEKKEFMVDCDLVVKDEMECSGEDALDESDAADHRDDAGKLGREKGGGQIRKWVRKAESKRQGRG